MRRRPGEGAEARWGHMEKGAGPPALRHAGCWRRDVKQRGDDVRVCFLSRLKTNHYRPEAVVTPVQGSPSVFKDEIEAAVLPRLSG